MKDSGSVHKNGRGGLLGRLVRAVALGVLCIVLVIAALNLLYRSRRTVSPSLPRSGSAPEYRPLPVWIITTGSA